MISGVKAGVAPMLDDFCGTVPKKFPFPPKGPQLMDMPRLFEKLSSQVLRPQGSLFDEFCGTVPKKPLPGPLPNPAPLDALSFQLNLR